MVTFIFKMNLEPFMNVKCGDGIKKSKYSLLVGDRVEFSEDGFVETILPRHNSMIRPAVANIDQVILVVASHNPDINELLLDKMLVMIEHADIPVILCINKCDVGECIRQMH